MEEEHKVIVVGLDNAGKTTILYQLSMNEVIHTRNGSKWTKVVEWFLLRKFFDIILYTKNHKKSDNWLQCRRNCLQECSFFHVGYWRTRITSKQLEYVFCWFRFCYFRCWFNWSWKTSDLKNGGTFLYWSKIPQTNI